MIRFWLSLVFLSAALAVKTCNDIDYCKRFRETIPDDNNRYSASLDTLKIDGPVATLTLNNKASNPLDLFITFLKGNKIRVKIEEPNSKRFQLKEILVAEPETVDISYKKEDQNVLTLKETEDAINEVVVEASPLKIKFIRDGKLLTTIDGDRLIMENGDSSAYAFAVTFAEAKSIIGYHEHAINPSLPETGPGKMDPFRMRNSDNGNYKTNSPNPTYGAIPVIYGHGTSATSGIFLFNGAEQFLDISKSESEATGYFMVEAGALDLFVFLGPSLPDVLKQYISLTGTAHLPQLWALGHHQCRYTYENQEDVKSVVQNFDNFNFPLDAIWLDIDYTDAKKYFTWEPNTFSDPVEMQKNISANGRKLVTIIDPHFKVDPDYPVYVGGKEKDLYIKNANGSNYEANCWPGLSSWFDFLNPEARDYYASWFAYDKFQGSTEVLAGIWNDMNEPAIFDDSTEKSAPLDSLHLGNVEHRNVHNTYGYFQTMATHKGLLERDNGTKRPFILTRSTFAGSQRYAAFWTGDIPSQWEYIKTSYQMCMNSNILGIVFCGADVGGFTTNPTEEIMQRWYLAAAWLPFFRNHADKGTNRKEPYVFSNETQAVIRTAMQTRYQHIPYWYTLFYEHTRDGSPLIRPLVYDYPQDENVFEIDDQILVGSSVLVRAIYESNKTDADVYFPGDGTPWYQVGGKDALTFYTGPGYQNIPFNESFIPVFYRAGTIIPVHEQVKASTSHMSSDPYTLYINLDKDGKANGTLYVDDFTSFEYRDKKKYNYLQFTYEKPILHISAIDSDNDPSGFEVIIEFLFIRELPNNGFGEYIQRKHSALSDGTPLKSVRITGREKLSFKLPL